MTRGVATTFVLGWGRVVVEVWRGGPYSYKSTVLEFLHVDIQFAQNYFTTEINPQDIVSTHYVSKSFNWYDQLFWKKNGDG